MATSENQIFIDSKSGVTVRVFRNIASDAYVHTITLTRATANHRWLIEAATLYDESDATAIRKAIDMIDARADMIDVEKRAGVMNDEGGVTINAFAPVKAVRQ